MAIIVDGLMVWCVHWDSMGISSAPVIVMWSFVVSAHGVELVSVYIRVMVSVVVVMVIHWLHL